MNLNARIYVAGHRGMVGSAIVRLLKRQGYMNIITKNRSELDLRDQVQVRSFFETELPQFVFMAAARVGGILANQHFPAEFLWENLTIQNNILHCAYRTRVSKLLFLGSSCIYPKHAPQPLREDYLLSGPLEPTNQWYAIAKIAGIKLCQALREEHHCDFICAMPTNLYGPNDNYDAQDSHVMAALIRKFHEAKERKAPEITCWGTGAPKREFLFVDDLASACLLLMNCYSQEQIINVGSASDLTIQALAELIRAKVGFHGTITWDKSKPDGTPRKIMDSSRIQALGWKPLTSLEDGIAIAYEDFLRRYGTENAAASRGGRVAAQSVA